MCWGSSSPSAPRAAAPGWCGWRTARRDCPPAPSSADWPACPGCSTTSRPGAMPGWRPTRSRAAWRPGGRGRPGVRGVALIRAPRTLPRVLEMRTPRRSWPRCARTGSSDGPGHVAAVAYGAARCSGCGCPTCARASGECSSPRGRAAESASCRSRPGSSPPSRPTTTPERPRTCGTDRVFVVPRPRRGRPLSAAGLDEIVDGARRRAGLEHLTCHQLASYLLHQAP